MGKKASRKTIKLGNKSVKNNHENVNEKKTTEPGLQMLMELKNKENQGILFQSIKRKANYELKMKNGEPKVDITVRVEGEIREKSTNALKLDNPGTIESIEKTFNQILEKEFATLITETQEKGSDIFGIGEYVRGKFPDYWDKEVQTGEQWKEIYKNLEITVTGKSKILRTGLKAQ